MRRVRRIAAAGLSLAVVMLVALVAVGAALAGEPAGEARRASPARPEEGSCPLSLGDQEKSVRAFAKMTPVFRHARCSNCHGGVNPFEADSTSKHGGGQMDPSVGAEQCQACHDQLPGWDTPGIPMFFIGKSDEDLCVQMKTFEESGASFVEHIRNDHGGIQFIAAGFKGERGLGKESQDPSDSGEPFAAVPPPGTQEELTQKAREWVKAMGGDYVGSKACGCRRGKIELKMTLSWTQATARNSVSAEASATVPLTPDSSGLGFSGAGPLVNGQFGLPVPRGCTVDVKPAGGELRVNLAQFGDEKPMTISLTSGRPTVAARQPSTAPGYPTSRCHSCHGAGSGATCISPTRSAMTSISIGSRYRR